MATYRGGRPRQWDKRRQPKLPNFQLDPPVDTAFLLKDLQSPIKTLPLVTSEPSPVKLCDVKAIASYSWIEAPTPTIAVPGSPWVWSDTHVTRVPLDKGVQQIHHNASKMGNQSPLLPLFAAVDALHEEFRYGDFDLITDRNTLRKFLRCIRGARDAHDRMDFRIDIDLIQNTCILTRCEERNTHDVGTRSGYGAEYQKATTKAPLGCEKMSGHHRIISYKFGGIKLLLRCTVDACTESDIDDDDLFLASFSSLSIRGGGNGSAQKPPPPPLHGLNVKLTSPRTVIPQSDLIEIKTRSAYRELDWDEIYPQLYLSQTAYLFIARHDRGTFRPVEKIELDGDDMKAHAKEAEETIFKLKVLLEDILKAVREEGAGSPTTLVCQDGTLTLWKREEGTGNTLGTEITSKFHRITSRGSQPSSKGRRVDKLG
ncbi:hypothetical protein HYDPIDRAFT_30535 [Hydnomerulius pinastri MD-312]|uniref:Geranylgeranyl pyrophosphate synthetase n=1 Tax=Hydnomerulius pinastri MD-312 TaxID=994086 RepID=A0A0C9WCM1_9AGAM|nr:hypothetical protein HYDPIDRAFT_30535 [Hydnomerulius pinastri MD-312]